MTESDPPPDRPVHLPAIVQPSALTTSTDAELLVPALIAAAGDAAGWRYVEFFTANIRNPNTRRAYARACSRFFAWCDDRRLTLTTIRPFDVATYIETLQQTHSAPFRATGITAYLANGGTLEHAQSMAAHESPRTTKLYDRTKERLTLDEVERIRL
jgi:hypothetical protein